MKVSGEDSESGDDIQYSYMKFKKLKHELVTYTNDNGQCNIYLF